MKVPEITTQRHKVGMCPACRAYLWADVDLTVHASPPTLTEDGKATVYATAKAVGMRLTHECQKDDEDSQALQSAMSIQPMPSPYRAQPCGPCRLDDHEGCTGLCPCGDEHGEPAATPDPSEATA